MARNESTDAKYARVRQLRAAGASFDEIAASLDDAGKPLYANRSTARQAWLRAVADEVDDAAKIPLSDLDRLEVDRLELLHRTMWPRAVRGENGAFDRVLRIAELRASIEARSGRHPRALLEAYDRTVAAASRVDAELDAALIELGRQYASQIDELRMVGSGSRALYLGPHLAAVLRELLATPAARDALLARVPATPRPDAGEDDDATTAGAAVANGRRGVSDFAAEAAKRRGR